MQSKKKSLNYMKSWKNVFKKEEQETLKVTDKYAQKSS